MKKFQVEFLEKSQEFLGEPQKELLEEYQKEFLEKADIFSEISLHDSSGVCAEVPPKIAQGVP